MGSSTEPGHIFLLGFMGSGKSLVARHLAGMLGRPCRDLDQLIESSRNCTIAEIFTEHGEAGFRTIESNLLREISTPPPAVIALGGGVFVPNENRSFIQSSGTSVWLQIPVETAWQRVEGDRNRPLATDFKQFSDLFQSRLHHYREAHLAVDVTSKTPEQIAAEIISLLKGDLSWPG